MSERGTKVTTDPESYQNPVREGAGAVTSDSLAGESIEQGGAFAEKNPGVGSMKQNAGSTTLNNTDTSNATTLPSAPDAQAREAQGEWNESRQLNAGSNLGKDAGVGPTYNTSSSGGNSGSGSGGFNSGGFSSGGDGSAFGSEESGIRGERTRATAAQHEQQAAGGISTATNDRSERAGENVTTAPSYVDAEERVTAGTGHQKPKGKNLKENEGFDGNEPNASFNSDILSKDDPARLQEQKMLNRDAGAGGGSMGGQGGFGGQSGVNNDNSFGGLRDESA